jgi:hypothetical protein
MPLAWLSLLCVAASATMFIHDLLVGWWRKLPANAATLALSLIGFALMVSAMKG